MNAANEPISSLGNASLLSLPGATAFLSSRRGSAKAAVACLEWAEGRRDDARPVIGGFHSDLEKDVLRLLLRGTCPIVLVLARTLWKEIPEELSLATLLRAYPGKTLRVFHELPRRAK